MLRVLIGFLPWIVFSLLATRLGPGAVTTAALLAFLVAAAFLARAKARGRSLKLLEVAGAVHFAVLAGLGLLYPAADAFLEHYGRGLSALALGAVVFATLPFMPFTEQYARESVPEQYWHTARFRAVNRRISAAWGAAIVGHAACHTLAALLAGSTAGLPTGAVDLLLNWVVPLALTAWAVRFTSRVSGEARSHTQRQDAPAAR